MEARSYNDVQIVRHTCHMCSPGPMSSPVCAKMQILEVEINYLEPKCKFRKSKFEIFFGGQNATFGSRN